jgi:hypothetical protein
VKIWRSKVQEQIKAQATDTSALTNIKSNLDLAWGKIQDGLQREAEGRKLWVDGTIDLITILDDARNRLGADKAFGTWLTDNGYGEDRITRHQRAALLNMAEHLDLTREVLEQTHRLSWEQIWIHQIQPDLADQPRLPGTRQPADGEEASDETPEALATTRRPKEKRGKQTPNENRDIIDWYNNEVAQVNARIDELNKVMERCSQEKHDDLQTLDLNLLSEASQKLTEKTVEFKDWVNTPFEKAAKQSRVVRIPKPKRRARRDALNQVQPVA